MRATSRTAITVAGLGIVTALVLLAATTVDDRGASSFPDSDYAWNPCQHVFDAEDVGDRLGWFFDEPLVASALVSSASGQGQHCSSTWTLNADGEVVDRVLAVGVRVLRGRGRRA